MEIQKESDNVIVLLGSKLPIFSDCLELIVQYSPTYKCEKQKKCVSSIVCAIYKLWLDVFPSSSLIDKSFLRSKINNALLEYEAVRKRGSKRVDKLKFLSKYDYLLDLMKKNEVNNLDCQIKTFYNDQQTVRNMSIRNMPLKSEDMLSYNTLTSDTLTYTCDKENSEYPEKSTESLQPLQYSQKPNRSGFVRIVKNTIDMATQTDVADHQYTQQIRKNGHFLQSIKNSLALCCVEASLTPNQCRKAFKSFSKNFYGSLYYLSIDELPEISEDDLLPDETTEEIPAKKRRNFVYDERYEFVLPSYMTIHRTKHILAIEQERNVALHLLEKSPDTKISLHYDTTSRAKFKGEFTSLIVELSNGRYFNLKPLPLSVENRDSICDFFIEELERLAVAANTDAKTIWECIDSLMTDAASKNTDIENVIAKRLGSSHVPVHCFCNSHFCECLDKGNLIVIKKSENAINLKEVLLSAMPELKSFLTSKTSVEAALIAFTKLTCNDGHKSSLYEEFDTILAEKQKTKKFSLLRERRFCMLGYSASAILFHLDDIEELLNKTKSRNLLVCACKLYIKNPFIINGIVALSFFTYHVTFPFFNFSEKSNQEDCVKILPQLFKDLQIGKIDTLHQYRVEYSFSVREIECELEQFLLNQFCFQASQDLKVQKGREYGFNSDNKQRAQDLSQLSSSELRGLPVNNMVCERQFGKVDHLLNRSGKCAPSNFQAKGIQDEIVLLGCDTSKLTNDKSIKSLKKLLDQREKSYMKHQEQNSKNRVERNQKANVRSEERNEHLLILCKCWGGPCVSVSELNLAIESFATDEKLLKKLLKTEISFRKITCPRDIIERPHLYKLNKLTTTQLHENLKQLLSTETVKLMEMPDEDEVMELIKQNFED